MQIVTKSEFARHAKRNPAQVTRWIASGKLTRPAVQDDGRIDLELGLSQVGARLHPSQQAALGTRAAAPSDDDGESDVQSERYLRLRADERELDIEAKRRRMMVDAGRWIERAEADRAQARRMTEVFTDLESWVQTCGQDIADETGIDARAATLVVRKSLHAFRARQAQKLRELAAALPEQVPELQAAE